MTTFNSITGQGARAYSSDVGSAGGTEVDPEAPTDPLGPGTIQSIDFIEEPPPQQRLAVAPLGGETVGVGEGGPSGPPPERPAVPVSGPTKPERAGPAPPIVSGLGKDVDDLLNKSPTAKEAWQRASANGWKIKVIDSKDPKDKSEANPDSKTIILNKNDVKTEGEGRAGQLATLLAHEIGHAAGPPLPRLHGTDMSDYVDKNTEAALRHEGQAALLNAKVRDEILAAGGPDIGTRGGLDDFIIDVYNRTKPPENLSPEEAVGLAAEFMAAEPEHSNGTNKEENFRMIFQAEYARKYGQP